MSKKLKFAALYPSHLDLNGDHGNLLVLQKRLGWRDVQVEIVAVEKPMNLDDFDFVFLGHGSKDAWADVLRIDPDLMSKVGKFSRDGEPVMAVSSGYELLIEELEPAIVEHSDHVSEFVDFDGVVGYVNSDVVLPTLQTTRKTFMTLLHGPVLAKNPDLADKIINAAGWCDVSTTSNVLESVSELAKASRRTAFED